MLKPTFVYQKGLFDEMTALTKDALHQHIKRQHTKAHVLGSVPEKGK